MSTICTELREAIKLMRNAGHTHTPVHHHVLLRLIAIAEREAEAKKRAAQ